MFSFVVICPASYCTCTSILMLKTKFVNDSVGVRSTMSISEGSHHGDCWSKHSPQCRGHLVDNNLLPFSYPLLFHF
uniref:Uncharacterized protein n=1 Tax=Aegilops tauschii subsp. strangulata TaxID=200361 RepID=A0A453PR80_AEGTS